MADSKSENNSLGQGNHGAADESEIPRGRAGGGAAAQVIAEAFSFVEQQPWVAVAGAFMGYAIAQLVKRLD